MERLAFITGASSGIGQALAGRYYEAGWRLALVARRSQDIHEWARARGWQPWRYSVYPVDVSDVDAVVAAGHACIAGQGVADVVIANAGISIGIDTAVRADLDVLARTYAVNNIGLAASFHPFVAPMVQRGRGALVGIASVAAIRGLPGHGAYCASKAGVVAYCESLRVELRGTGVNVVTLSPGFVDTPLTHGNRYAMPFLMSPDAFARKAMRAIERRVSYRVIPWQMGVVAKVLRLLPDGLFDRLMTGRPRKRRMGE